MLRVLTQERKLLRILTKLGELHQKRGLQVNYDKSIAFLVSLLEYQSLHNFVDLRYRNFLNMMNMKWRYSL